MRGLSTPKRVTKFHDIVMTEESYRKIYWTLVCFLQERVHSTFLQKILTWWLPKLLTDLLLCMKCGSIISPHRQNSNLNNEAPQQWPFQQLKRLWPEFFGMLVVFWWKITSKRGKQSITYTFSMILCASLLSQLLWKY